MADVLILYAVQVGVQPLVLVFTVGLTPAKVARKVSACIQTSPASWRLMKRPANLRIAGVMALPPAGKNQSPRRSTTIAATVSPQCTTMSAQGTCSADPCTPTCRVWRRGARQSVTRHCSRQAGPGSDGGTSLETFMADQTPPTGPHSHQCASWLRRTGRRSASQDRRRRRTRPTRGASSRPTHWAVCVSLRGDSPL